MFRNKLLGIASAFVLSAAMLAGPVAAAADSSVESAVEDTADYVIATNTKMPDFTAKMKDGEFILSEELKTHDAVLLNFWATWCPGCKAELPYLQEAAASRDDVSVLLVSTDPSDTIEKIQAFEDEQGYTLPFAEGGSEVTKWYQFPYIPGTVIIDRNGIVTYAENEVFSSAAAVNRLMDEFTGSDYETHVVTEIPAAEINVQPEEQQTLESVLGSGFTFSTPEGDWPMICDAEESAVRSSNQEIETKASLEAVFTADGAMSFDVKVDGEEVCDLLDVYLDGERVKSFMHCDWKTWTLPLNGEHTVRFEFTKLSEGEGCAKLANFRLLKEDEAVPNPDYPMHEETEVTFLSPAKQVVFRDPEIAEAFGAASIWLTDRDEAEVLIRTAEDPDAVFFLGAADTEAKALADEEFTDDGFLLRKTVEQAGDVPCAVFHLFTLDGLQFFVVFQDEADIEKMAEWSGMEGDWSYDLKEAVTISGAEEVQTAESVEEEAR